jgi:hypothetical protein
VQCKANCAGFILGIAACHPLFGQTAVTPIARWDVVPYQRINPGGSLNVGVVAFSKNGIDRVDFTITGQGYSGAPTIEVREMSLNPQSGAYEYWMPIQASQFQTDGPITVEAAVYGPNAGEVRDKDTGGGGLGLDQLPLVVNATGGLPQAEAWVSHTGVDEGENVGLVNNPTRPFATVGGALKAVCVWRQGQGFGNNADGALIRVMPSEEPYRLLAGTATGEIPCVNEWATITTADGGSQSNTILEPPRPGDDPIVPVRKLCFRGLKLDGGGTLDIDDEEARSSRLWADGCALVGDGQGLPWPSHPISDYSHYAGAYYTDTSITQLGQATSGAELCRGLQISHIHDDAFQDVSLVVNCTVDDINPLDTGEHADVWQHWGGNEVNQKDDNVIVYGLRATNIYYQNLFIRPDVYSPPSYAEGMAFVNVYMSYAPDIPPDWNKYGGWYRWVDHLLWWHCSLGQLGIGIAPETYTYEGNDHEFDPSIRNFSCKGCDFAFLAIYDGTDGDVDWSGWDHNHFVYGEYEPWDFVERGDHRTVGDNLLNAFGTPGLGSPLLRRFDPALTVPVDQRNYDRTYRADVGAYQSQIGWEPKNPANHPSARKYHAMAYDLDSQKVVLFGGLNDAGDDDDETWEWNGATGDWTRVYPYASPPAQHGHAMMGELSRPTVVGRGFGPEMANFCWDSTLLLWWGWPMWEVAQRRHAAAFCEASGVGYFFGGQKTAQTGDPLGDTWIFGMDMYQELQLDPSPAPRSGHAVDTAPFQVGKVPAILFGGQGHIGFFDDTWAFGGGGDLMFRSAVLTAMGYSSSVIGSDPIILGGGGEGGWVELDPTASPTARTEAELANNVLFGGYGYLPGGGVGLLGDTWVFVPGDPPTWRQLDVLGPTPRRAFAMVRDPSQNVIVLFGGETSEGRNYETWVFNLDEDVAP